MSFQLLERQYQVITFHVSLWFCVQKPRLFVGLIEPNNVIDVIAIRLNVEKNCKMMIGKQQRYTKKIVSLIMDRIKKDVRFTISESIGKKDRLMKLKSIHKAEKLKQ